MLSLNVNHLSQKSGLGAKRARFQSALLAALASVPLLLSMPVHADHDKVKLSAARFFSPEEGLLINALHGWEDGNSALAQTNLDSLLLLAPKFGVASSLRAAIRKQPNPKDTGIYNAFMSQDLSEASKTEFKQRWNYLLKPASGTAKPTGLLQLSESQQHAVMVDLTLNRLYIFKNEGGQPQLIADFYAGIGSEGFGKLVEGDRKTPVGVYFVTSELVDDELDELYGVGAFPLNYPNALDRQQERTGSGIWIHGVPRNTWSRAPQSSRGCVTMANRDFQRLKNKVAVRQTPVILSQNIEWSEQAQGDLTIELLEAIEKWSGDWESLDTERYLANYSPDFIGQGMNFAQWSEHKHRVNKRKTSIDVTLSDISLLQDPQTDVVVATFKQEYQSSNFNSVDRKRQYWQRQANGEWKILLENGV